MDWFKAREAWVSNRWMFPVIWIIAILFWMFLAANAFLTVLVINVLLWLALIFLWILLIIRGFGADKKRIEWMEDIPWIEDYDDSDD
jgi:uncharacterized membrane protein HdeD (DUF308 family)